MTRKSCAFVVCLLAICSTLVPLTWAQTSDRFSAYWGAQYSAPAPDASIAARHHTPPPAGVDRVHHWNRVAGPTGRGDGNARTIGDPAWTPLGAPASSLQGPNFTPPFPAYPSGHAVFGGALFQTLRNFYGTDNIPFTFTSDELNGETRDNHGVVRPLLPRSFRTLSQAEEENGQSRIYLGIHFSFDKTAGIAQGRRIGNFVFRNAFRPRG